MDLKEIKSRLKDLENIHKKDFYVSFYSDELSLIKTIDDDDFYIHSFNLKHLKNNLISLRNKDIFIKK